ncbi:VOC family protein [Streptomyces sp. TRM66268-LWL]|uniref:VOC family protein n=1 Tax=Streptomyces polyasparticus TaxID=2767826 RepID=A0ABR7SHR5_9ACTN|nr:VOC family protein [Streptomyces polyasparticus]MBC9714963.1 VOC family protein [Streptomyces polyasparticus]
MYIDFYVNKLGFELRFDKEVTPGLRWIEVGLPGRHANIGILSAAATPDRPAVTNWATLHTTDLATTRAELLTRDVEVGEPVSAPWGPFAMVTDPEGNQIILAEVPL